MFTYQTPTYQVLVGHEKQALSKFYRLKSYLLQLPSIGNYPLLDVFGAWKTPFCKNVEYFHRYTFGTLRQNPCFNFSQFFYVSAHHGPHLYSRFHLHLFTFGGDITEKSILTPIVNAI